MIVTFIFTFLPLPFHALHSCFLSYFLKQINFFFCFQQFLCILCTPRKILLIFYNYYYLSYNHAHFYFCWFASHISFSIFLSSFSLFLLVLLSFFIFFTGLDYSFLLTPYPHPLYPFIFAKIVYS